MSREGLVQFITRALEDEKFRTEVKANPDAALAQFDLTAEEIAAIKSADRAKLQEMGIDERVSKVTTYASTQMLVTTGPSAEGATAGEEFMTWLYWLVNKT